MELTKDQINQIHASLEHGTKKILAEHLGIHQVVLSRYLHPTYKRNKTTGKFKQVYQMPAEVYNKIVDFINQ